MGQDFLEQRALGQKSLKQRALEPATVTSAVVRWLSQALAALACACVPVPGENNG